MMTFTVTAVSTPHLNYSTGFRERTALFPADQPVAFPPRLLARFRLPLPGFAESPLLLAGKYIMVLI